LEQDARYLAPLMLDVRPHFTTWKTVNMNQSHSKLGLNGTWSMAVGGMVGRGIFSTLGVVVGIAGARTWLSFATAGLIALATGYRYVKLAAYCGEGGRHENTPSETPAPRVQ